MLRRSALVLAISLAPQVVAAATLYDCTMRKSSSNDWVSGRLAIVRDGDRAVVSDAVILYFVGKPVDATIDADNPRRITFRWALKITNPAHQSTTMIYRASYLKANRQLSVTATPAGYDNTFQKFGSCALNEVQTP